MKLSLLIALAAVAGIFAAQAAIVWQEDFSDVSDWTILVNPMGDAGISSDGLLGTFSEPTGGVNDPRPTFAPTSANRFAFDPALSSYYSMEIVIDSLSWSASHAWALDEFDSGGSYLSTVWNVFPSENRSTLGFNPAGPVSTNIALGQFTYNANTAFLAPKFDLSTGDAGQALVLDSITVTQTIPEPATATMMLIGGALGVYLLRRR